MVDDPQFSPEAAELFVVLVGFPPPQAKLATLYAVGDAMLAMLDRLERLGPVSISASALIVSGRCRANSVTTLPPVSFGEGSLSRCSRPSSLKLLSSVPFAL